VAVFDRVVWIVLDSVGIGPLPDAADYGDVGPSSAAPDSALICVAPPVVDDYILFAV
jgi:hypothetical protein